LSYMMRENPPAAKEVASLLAGETPTEDTQTEGPRIVRQEWRSILAGTAGFIAANMVVTRVLPLIVPAVAALPPTKRKEFSDNVLALLHHAIAAPWALLRLRDDWRQQAERGPAVHIDYSGNTRIVSFTMAYFLADFLNALRTIRQTPDAAFHHLAGIIVISGLRRGRIMRWIPHVLVAEISSVFLCLMWFMRQLGRTGSPPYNAAGVTFVLLFTATRIVHLPVMLATLALKHKKDLDALGRGKWMMPLVQALQFYWYSKILRQFAPLITTLMR
jgi:hypothetical protein